MVHRIRPKFLNIGVLKIVALSKVIIHVQFLSCLFLRWLNIILNVRSDDILGSLAYACPLVQ